MAASEPRNNSIVALQRMSRELEREMNDGTFDQQDLAYVTNLLTSLHKEQQLRNSQQQRQTNERLKHLHKIVNTRQTVLDRISQDTNLFEDFPEMLNYFHEKQVKLMELLETIKSEAAERFTK